MLQVLIVDDEPWVAYGIAHLIDWESLGCRVGGEAHNGQEALAYISRHKPEIVISDIRMPGLDGIMLLEKINGLQLNTKVILISGYADFEYAQKAIRLGAFDYLVKQIDESKLEETIRRAAAELEKGQETAFAAVDLFLEDLFELLDPANRITISNFQANRQLAAQYPHYRFLGCLYPAASSARAVFHGNIASLQDISAVRFRTGQNKVSILVNYDEQHHPLALLNFISEYVSGAEYVGISSIGLYSTPIARLFQESEIAMFSSYFHQGAAVAPYKRPEVPDTIRKLLLNLELSVKENDKEQTGSLLAGISRECGGQQLHIDQIAAIYNQIVSMIYKYRGGMSHADEMEYLSYEQIVRLFHSPEQLFRHIHLFMNQLARQEVNISNEQVEKVIAYINQKFTEDILLSDISKRFNISTGHLSSLIKKQTGTTYSEYIMNKRLTMAKELLSNTALSVFDIVQEVGYKDYYHFNKLFKKMLGITPSQYRKL